MSPPSSTAARLIARTDGARFWRPIPSGPFGAVREVVSSAKDSSMIRLIVASTDAHWSHGRTLAKEYAATLHVDLSFQNFAHELEHLSEEYGLPNGAFLLADADGRYAGCVGLRRFSGDTGEIKRLYVVPDWRGQGIGRHLVKGAIDAAIRIGYTRLVLDTLPSMMEAQALYVSLGFAPVPPYRFNPVPGTSFLELRLPGASSACREA